MGGFVGFLLGYYVGAKDGPERLEELREAVESIAASSDFQALRSSLVSMAESALGKVQENLASAKVPDAADTSAAWKAISESEEFRGLMASGAQILQGVLSNLAPRKDGDGHAEL